MCRTVFLVIFGILCYSSKSLSENIETLMDHVVVLRVRDIDGSKAAVPLRCGEGFQNEPVTWKKNGMPRPDLQGNNIRVTVQEWDGGNYTCHLGQDGPYLNHTVIMVQLEPDNRTVILKERGPEEGYIHCSTPNYSSSFYCTWTRTKDRSDAAVLLVKGHRNEETIQCEVKSSGSGIWCVDTHNCPYQEEQHRITLTVYLYSVSRLEAYTKAFYLWEIVTPEKLPDLHFQSVNKNENVFRWDYPMSWEKPCSFFSLHFQVKVVHNRESCDASNPILEQTISKTVFEIQNQVRAKKYGFCVRAQDKYTGGPWSQWSKCKVNLLASSNASHKPCD